MLTRRLIATAIALIASAAVCLSAQTPQLFQFFISATDASGTPLTELRAEDVIMSEDGVNQPIVKVEPLPVPVKLTIAIDNGLDSGDAIDHFRAGLAGLIDALPADVEVTVIATAPQPRTVVKPTTDHAQILKGLKNFAPENAAPRFTDTLIEFSDRLQKEAKDSKVGPYVPVLLMLSTGTNEHTQYQPKQIEKAVTSLAARRGRFNAMLVSTRHGDVEGGTHLKSSSQGLISASATRMTNGRYEEVLVPTRVATMLPEWGRDLAKMHVLQSKQFRVTVERGSSGELKNPKIEVSRAGINATVTRDGYLP